jgi:hypothetical protein
MSFEMRKIMLETRRKCFDSEQVRRFFPDVHLFLSSTNVDRTATTIFLEQIKHGQDIGCEKWKAQFQTQVHTEPMVIKKGMQNYEYYLI